MIIRIDPVLKDKVNRFARAEGKTTSDVVRELLEELLKLFATGFHIVFTTRTPEVHVVADPDDDKFIACALALKAQYVVSGDKALIDVRQYQGINIVTPREFLEIRGVKP